MALTGPTADGDSGQRAVADRDQGERAERL